MEKKHVILLTVIAVATLLITVVGATFAYYTATIEGNKSAQEIKIGSATLAITYNDGKEIKVRNIVPGWKGTKTISIEYPKGTDDESSSIDLSYAITWEGVENTFKSEEQSRLKYSVQGVCNIKGDEGNYDQVCSDATSRLKNDEEGTTTTLPTTSANKANNITGEIKKGEKHTYTITLTYENNPSGAQDNHDDKEIPEPAKFNARFNVTAGPAGTGNFAD